ncbi:MAG: hypothetical protein NC902_06650, partial [Candidatus Omnitrophica bacterium]|nr:hypothetical protein [Candidatus Omnitrophota bacterium]
KNKGSCVINIPLVSNNDYRVLVCSSSSDNIKEGILREYELKKLEIDINPREILLIKIYAEEKR